ncbi:helix-turn-helix domain-containing protein [Hydrogenophaga sp. PBL-H3]|uniref:helix-turn-helix domain-containing protein n=1 Tax=Hydrogenophaga sp. PBL-H3 TaxID=434010 RepID=UPI00131FEA29|nr:helix-turn-helix transcriptional regulator [Hydrogenophaga sp. PBL-H3]QHE75893.1 helix-turn-helix domain-containing protein [Hydrogenophaga sp. PBL-H3]QHE80318.1 helix-turn-helix domain-containing protein [Hydrogenophaga sp. PBL-H3]
MPAHAPPPSDQSTAQLQALGEQIRARRKALRVSSTAAAEAAGMSRVTLHRIEKGEPSVAGGAWANAMVALGMTLLAKNTEDADVSSASPVDLTDWIPVRVRLADYPQLKALAWQVHGTDTLTPMEALGIYERNVRHLDTAAMSPEEQALLQALRTGLGGGASVGMSNV